MKKLFVLVGFTLVLLPAVCAGHSSARDPKPVQVPAAEVSAPTACFKLGGSDPKAVAPVFISKPNPKYTAEALSNRIQGVITLYVLVHKNGKVEVTGAQNRLGYGLDEEAIRVGRAARFKPGIWRGHPSEWHHVLYVDFRLPKES